MDNEIDNKGMRLSDIIKYYFDDKIWVDRKYQRKLVWELQDKELFIRSLLESIPVPAVIYAENKESDREKCYHIIDGLQRTNAIVSFMTGEFAVEYDGEKRYFDLNECHYTSKALKEGKITQKEPILDSQISFNLAGSTIPVILIAQDDKKIEKIFNRINSTGRKLSPQDIRQSASCNQFAELIKNFASAIRGDFTYSNLVCLSDIPKISFGYGLNVEDTFWVKNQIFDAFRLKDSKDEEIIAKLVIAIMLGVNDASSELLDAVYDDSNKNHIEIMKKIKEYNEKGKNLIEDLCIVGRAVQQCYERYDKGFDNNLKTTNEKIFRIVFQATFKAFDHNCDITKLCNISEKIFGLIEKWDKSEISDKSWDSYVEQAYDCIIYNIVKEDGVQRYKLDLYLRLEENPYESQMTEYKLGFTKLDCDKPYITQTANYTVKRIAKTLSAMANTSKRNQQGYVIIGVADSKKQADKWRDTFNSEYICYGNHYIVGVDKEIEGCFQNADAYMKFFLDELNKCDMDYELKEYVEQNISFITFEGKKLLIIPSVKLGRDVYFDNKKYVRKGSSVVEIK